MLTMTKSSIIKNYFNGMTVKQMVKKLFDDEKLRDSKTRKTKFEVQEYVETTISKINWEKINRK